MQKGTQNTSNSLQKNFTVREAERKSRDLSVLIQSGPGQGTVSRCQTDQGAFPEVTFLSF